MGLLKSTRLAWSIAIASLALWAASAPLGWSQVLPIAGGFLQQAPDPSNSTASIDNVVNDTTTTDSDTPGNVPAIPCPAMPDAKTQPPAPAPAAASASGATEGTYQLCGPDDQAARSIEQLIAGRSFSASLSTSGNGCASLTIKTTSAAPASGRASSTVKVSLGSGQPLSIQIVSEGGATHVTIGQAS
jgi:hypothetical protein